MKILLAKPRGFCAGVERAILSVERALACYGAPVYVLNAIVHNTTVVEGLKAQGAVFVRSLDEVPEGAHILFSAHGVGPERWAQAERRGLTVIDATCPLVEKVHREAKRYAAMGYTIILIGEKGHDEVVGTQGWAGERIEVVLTDEDVGALCLPADAKLVYLAQTTLSAEDCGRVVRALKARFPGIEDPPSSGICYATQNRQRAVNDLSPEAGLVLVVGDRSSANANRLVEICRRNGKTSHLIAGAMEIDPAWLARVDTVLVTSGASVPEFLVQGVVARLGTLGYGSVDERAVVDEDVHFRLPDTFRRDDAGD